MSTAEAEHVALVSATQEALWLWLQSESMNETTVIFKDNKSAISIYEISTTKYVSINKHQLEVTKGSVNVVFLHPLTWLPMY